MERAKRKVKQRSESKGRDSDYARKPSGAPILWKLDGRAADGRTVGVVLGVRGEMVAGEEHEQVRAERLSWRSMTHDKRYKACKGGDGIASASSAGRDTMSSGCRG